MPQADMSWWDRLIAGLSGQRDVPPPHRPTPPKVDESAWAHNVEMARISPYLSSVHDLGLIVFGETQSYTDRPDSNEPIANARQKLAHSVMNADAKWGAARPQYAGTASPVEPSENALRNPIVRTAYESSMTAAREAYVSGTDPTNGAVYLNQRVNASRANRVMSNRKRNGVSVSTQSGPYNNLYPNQTVPSRIAWLLTYHDE